ncbi:MAG TPA: ketopantoate reductase C-terminal domain-containing protein, partial [Phototrophicaceae bacterium]|nr:ketopantoate reductase C-terminal domain-containing protein [Phototrophicaceae bacterium]
LRTVLPHLTDNGLLVSMQNGINPPLLAEKVGIDRTIGMAIRMGCRKVAPGHVQTAIPGHLYIGHLHGKTTPQLDDLQRTLSQVMDTEITDNILGVLWSKLTYTCLGYYGSMADASLVESCASEACRRNLTQFFAEVVAVGKASDARFISLAEYNPLDFHPSIPFEKRLAAVDQFAKSWKIEDRKGPLRQIQKGIKTEVDFTLAYVVRQGEKLRIATPLCRKVLDMIHELEQGMRKLGLQNYDELRSVSAK